NEIHIPVGKPVALRLDAVDVLHEFWVPELGRKLTTVPGHPNHLWIHPTNPRRILGFAQSFAGLSMPGCTSCLLPSHRQNLKNGNRLNSPLLLHRRVRTRRRVSLFSSR